MPSEKAQPLVPPEPDPHGEEKVPNPDLNPLTNPTLARNLGKWAQVYFTTPREQRDQAVSELLRDLENPGASHSARSETLDEWEGKAREVQARATETNSLANLSDTGNHLLCPRCRRVNTADNCFCGYCGSALRETGAAFTTPAMPLMLPRDDTGGFPVPRAPSSRMSDAQATDLEWLREKSMRSVRTRDRVRHSLRRVLVIVLLAGVGAFFYFRSRNGDAVWSGPKRVISASSAAAPQPASEATRLNPSAATPAAIATRAHMTSERIQPPDKSDAQQGKPLRDSSSPAFPGALDIRHGQSEGSSSDDSGDRELAIAETFLRGDTKVRDASEAAKWLWKSVSKHNATALVLLADLYERGEGVNKNCEQAQVLLTAGAKKGSAEAAQRLRNLQSSGCK